MRNVAVVPHPIKMSGLRECSLFSGLTGWVKDSEPVAAKVVLVRVSLYHDPVDTNTQMLETVKYSFW